jgi:hypothetical protein
LSIARFIENTASSAVNAAPSWNFTPWRSVMRSCVGLSCFQPVASTGSSSNFRL